MSSATLPRIAAAAKTLAANDAGRARLIEGTEIVEDAALPPLSAHVEVTMQDGRVIASEVRVGDLVGTVAAP